MSQTALRRTCGLSERRATRETQPLENYLQGFTNSLPDRVDYSGTVYSRKEMPSGIISEQKARLR